MESAMVVSRTTGEVEMELSHDGVGVGDHHHHYENHDEGSSSSSSCGVVVVDARKYTTTTSTPGDATDDTTATEADVSGYESSGRGTTAVVVKKLKGQQPALPVFQKQAAASSHWDYSFSTVSTAAISDTTTQASCNSPSSVFVMSRQQQRQKQASSHSNKSKSRKEQADAAAASKSKAKGAASTRRSTHNTDGIIPPPDSNHTTTTTTTQQERGEGSCEEDDEYLSLDLDDEGLSSSEEEGGGGGGMECGLVDGVFSRRRNSAEATVSTEATSPPLLTPLQKQASFRRRYSAESETSFRRRCGRRNGAGGVGVDQEPTTFPPLQLETPSTTCNNSSSSIGNFHNNNNNNEERCSQFDAINDYMHPTEDPGNIVTSTNDTTATASLSGDYARQSSSSLPGAESTLTSTPVRTTAADIITDESQEVVLESPRPEQPELSPAKLLLEQQDESSSPLFLDDSMSSLDKTQLGVATMPAIVSTGEDSMSSFDCKPAACSTSTAAVSSALGPLASQMMENSMSVLDLKPQAAATAAAAAAAASSRQQQQQQPLDISLSELDRKPAAKPSPTKKKPPPLGATLQQQNRNAAANEKSLGPSSQHSTSTHNNNDEKRIMSGCPPTLAARGGVPPTRRSTDILRENQEYAARRAAEKGLVTPDTPGTSGRARRAAWRGTVDLAATARHYSNAPHRLTRNREKQLPGEPPISISNNPADAVKLKAQPKPRQKQLPEDPPLQGNGESATANGNTSADVRLVADEEISPGVMFIRGRAPGSLPPWFRQIEERRREHEQQLEASGQRPEGADTNNNNNEDPHGSPSSISRESAGRRASTGLPLLPLDQTEHSSTGVGGGSLSDAPMMMVAVAAVTEVRVVNTPRDLELGGGCGGDDCYHQNHATNQCALSSSLSSTSYRGGSLLPVETVPDSRVSVIYEDDELTVVDPEEQLVRYVKEETVFMAAIAVAAAGTVAIMVGVLVYLST